MDKAKLEQQLEQALASRKLHEEAYLYHRNHGATISDLEAHNRAISRLDHVVTDLRCRIAAFWP